MTAAALLAKHVDQVGKRHRLTLLDDHRLKCHDCQRTLLLPVMAGSTSGTSQNPDLAQTCGQHPGEFAGRCRCCTADRLEAPPPSTAPWQPTADVSAGAAAVRAALDRQEPLA